MTFADDDDGENFLNAFFLFLSLLSLLLWVYPYLGYFHHLGLPSVAVLAKPVIDFLKQACGDFDGGHGESCLLVVTMMVVV